MARENTPAKFSSPSRLRSGAARRRLEADLPVPTPSRHAAHLHTIGEDAERNSVTNPAFEDDTPSHHRIARKYYQDVGNWQAHLSQYLWPGGTEIGYDFQRWYSSAINGLRTAVALYPPGVILPSRLLQAVRSIAGGPAYYTSEYTHWLQTQLRSHQLLERAFAADNTAILPGQAVEWWDTNIFAPWLTQFGRTTQLDRLKLETLTYPNDPNGTPIIPKPPPHKYIRTILELYTEGLDDSAIVRLLRRIQATLPEEWNLNNQFDNMCYDAGKGAREFPDQLAIMERSWAINIQKQSLAGGLPKTAATTKKAVLVAAASHPTPDVEALVAQARAQERALAVQTGGVTVKPEHGPAPQTGGLNKYCALHGWNRSHTDPACNRHKPKKKWPAKEQKGKENSRDKKVALTAEPVKDMVSERIDKMEKMLEAMQTMMVQQRATTPFIYAAQEQLPAQQHPTGGGLRTRRPHSRTHQQLAHGHLQADRCCSWRQVFKSQHC